MWQADLSFWIFNQFWTKQMCSSIHKSFKSSFTVKKKNKNTVNDNFAHKSWLSGDYEQNF